MDAWDVDVRGTLITDISLSTNTDEAYWYIQDIKGRISGRIHGCLGTTSKYTIGGKRTIKGYTSRWMYHKLMG